MSPAQRRIILTLALIAFIAASLIFMRAQREPRPEPQQKQEAAQKQTPPPEQQLAQTYEAQPDSRAEQKPPQQQTQQQPPPVAPQPPTPQEQATPQQEPHARVGTDVHALISQLEDYRTRTGAYPSTLDGLRSLGIAVPKDPWQRDYFYESPSRRNRESYDLFSAGPDGIPDTADDDWGDDTEQN